MLAGVNDSTVFLSLLFISMYAGFCFGVGGFPVKECRNANSASILNFLRISINHWLTMVAILQLKAFKLIVYFVSFTVVIFTILNINLAADGVEPAAALLRALLLPSE